MKLIKEGVIRVEGDDDEKRSEASSGGAQRPSLYKLTFVFGV